MDHLAQLRSSLAQRYEIEHEIGAGGMATVYLARDLRHDRKVALKVLKPDLGAVLGSERFLAEIKVTANLQHPNLLPLFDSGEAEGLLFYVMPYVEGETLRHRLDREKQLPVDEAIRISVAIASALDYAHSHGIIHRDLKPENILLQAGQPVIADFGIALAVSKAGGNRITQTGLSLGTPNYMSPEQATGDRVIDARSDIYSLGAMTYEMLTGEPPHTGHTSQAVIARMLTETPRPIRNTRSAVPEYVDEAVQRALEKLPADRYATVREFAEALRGRMDLSTTITSSAKARSERRKIRDLRKRLKDPVDIALAVIAVAALAGMGAMLLSPQTGRDAPANPVRFVLTTPDSARAFDNFPWPGAISPDGSSVVYSAIVAGEPMLMLQRTNQLDAQPISGTRGGFQPVFSPDGQSIVFEDGGKIRKVRLDGSAPVTISDGGSANGMDWTVNDEIISGSDGDKHGLLRVNAAGGELAEFAKPDKAKGESDYLWPIAFPDGKRVVFVIWTGSLASARLATASIDKGDVVPLNLAGVRPLAIIDRVLVYVRVDGSVMGVTLDRSGRKTTGVPTPVLDPVGVVAGNNGNSQIFVSKGGALLTSRGGSKSQLAWIKRDGSTQLVAPSIRDFTSPRLSPDGRSIAVTINDQDKSAIWIHDLATSTMSRLSNFASALSPQWMPDSRHVVYVALGDKERFAIWSQDADGGSAPRKLFDAAALVTSVTVSPDGRNVLQTTYRSNSWHLIRVPVDSPTAPVTYLSHSGNSLAPSFSPDGKWVALVSSESGQAEVYVRSFPNPSARVQVSAGSGTAPAWSADGSTVFYNSQGVFMSAKVMTTPSLRVISRDTVFARPPTDLGGAFSRNYDLTKDGRILGLLANKNDYQLVVVPNWLPELRQRMARNRK